MAQGFDIATTVQSLQLLEPLGLTGHIFASTTAGGLAFPYSTSISREASRKPLTSRVVAKRQLRLPGTLQLLVRAHSDARQIVVELDGRCPASIVQTLTVHVSEALHAFCILRLLS